ncbi:MAG TPA: EAL domain-containing protein [Clostridiales bacterium]|nr:EAL domain-containing protein [Clostridiales bacterium]
MGQKYTKEKARRPGNSIMSRILLPVVIAIFVQAGLFSINIIWGGTLDKLNHNAFDILNGQVVNRRNYLQGEMLGRWSNLDPAAQNIHRILEEKQGGSEENSSIQNQLLMQSAPELISLLRRNLVTGVFLVLTDGEVYDDSGRLQKHALYIRDMDPETSSANNSDLLLLHAPARISKELAIPLDSNWTSYVSFSPGESASWNYYRKPYEAALAYPEIGEKNLGYWSPAFRTEGDSLDTITYSMPLRDSRGAVRAVLGVELSTDYLGKLVPYQELNTQKQGMYLIGIANGDGLAFDTQLSTGPVYKHLFGKAKTMEFVRQEGYGNAFRVSGNLSRPEDTVYGCIQYFELYNTNTPFEKERWALIGMQEKDQLLGFSRGVTNSIWVTLGVSLLLGLATAWAASALLTSPITRLLRQLRKSDPRHSLALDKLQISEIDELSGAIEILSTRVAREASRLSRIIDMAGVEIGAFEALPGDDRVFCTGRFFEMLGIEEKLEQDGTISQRELDTLMETLTERIEDQTEDGSIKLLRIQRTPEEVRWVRLKVVATKEHITGVVSDITREVLERCKIERERDYDSLTNLLNRRAFSTEIARRFKDPQELGIAALVMLDLDNLKFINDSYGHDCGDAYLCSTADALRCYSPEQALIARMSGDEFYVLFSGYSSREEAEEDIRILKEGLRQATFPLPDHSRFNIRASAGIAWYPEHATTYEKLLKYADFAMYQVKKTTKGEFGEFDLEDYSQNSYLLQNREEINRLIDQELVDYYFQPIVDARSGAVFGYEALMRPLLDTIKTPAKVLALAKMQSKLHAIERLTWKRSLTDFEKLANVDRQIRLFINSVANQLLGEKDIKELQERFSHLLPRVVIEITEEERSTEAATHGKLEWAAGWGCQVALDDFGTGYNSDTALLAINPDFVKLDISIVRNVDTDVNRRKLLQNLLSYAESRGIRVIAEGVETSAELHALIELGVDYVQGYYIARPQPEPAPLSSGLVEEIQEAFAAVTRIGV